MFIKKKGNCILCNCVKKRECRIVYIVIIVFCLMVSSDCPYAPQRLNPLPLLAHTLLSVQHHESQVGIMIIVADV